MATMSIDSDGNEVAKHSVRAELVEARPEPGEGPLLAQQFLFLPQVGKDDRPVLVQVAPDPSRDVRDAGARLQVRLRHVHPLSPQAPSRMSASEALLSSAGGPGW